MCIRDRPNTKEDLIEMLSLAHTNAETKYGDNVDEQKMHCLLYTSNGIPVRVKNEVPVVFRL